MKKLIGFSLIGACFGMLLLSSCSKDDETETTPSSSDPRGKFTGHWLITEHSSISGSGSYYVDVTDSTNVAYLQFAYLYGYHTKIRATASGTTITIPTQIVEGNSVSGSGTSMSASQFTLRYVVALGGSSYDTVNATLTK